MPRNAEIKSLFYITHVENVPSILQHGILSHALIESRNLPFTPHLRRCDREQSERTKATPERGSLWEYANLYFQPRNPMMYRVFTRKPPRILAVVGVKPGVLQLPQVMITDGNAASNPTRFFKAAEGLKVIEAQWPAIQAEYWNDLDGSKRKIMAECLVPDQFPRDHIHTVFVADHETKKHVEGLIWPANNPRRAGTELLLQAVFPAEDRRKHIARSRRHVLLRACKR